MSMIRFDSTPDIPAQDKKWFALFTRPRYDKSVVAQLRYKGIEEYLPLRCSRGKWSDRDINLDLALFLGYVFCRFARNDRSKVLQTSGVIAILGKHIPILVEFMFTIPAGVVCRPGESRGLMRRAFAGMLPESELRRRSKSAYETMFAHSFRLPAAELLRDVSGMRLVERGYLDRDSTTLRLRRFVQGLDCNEAQLGHVILLELWLRAQEHPAQPGAPEQPAEPCTLIAAVAQPQPSAPV